MPNIILGFSGSDDLVNRLLDEESAMQKWLKKEGIERVETGLGYSERNKAWYGWSHRAWNKFRVSDVVKEGDVVVDDGGIKPGYKVKNLKDAERLARIFAQAVS